MERGLPYAFILSFSKGCAACLLTIAGIASTDLYIIGVAFIIGIINTFHCLAVDIDHFARMLQSTQVLIALCFFKGIAACL